MLLSTYEKKKAPFSLPDDFIYDGENETKTTTLTTIKEQKKNKNAYLTLS